MSIAHRISFVLVVLSSYLTFAQQREPVLKQIDLPHSYYYREMYLPQLTTGPSAAAWTPDSRLLVYSMAGSLWRQPANGTTAEQITSGAGYDYQPDVSHDGHWVVYTCYLKDAVELWALNLQTKETRQLTSGGAVNLEPRFSPDGQRIVFVSTSYHGHFHIFVGQFSDGALTNVQRITGENRSDLPRYYYSQFDHEISPAWSTDGTEIVFVSNRGHIQGTGGFWRMKAVPGAEAREIHYEETTWKARPDFSPDGMRLVYASYLGQQWHQLWVIPAQGGDAFPLSYGDFDNINPRWSPDGKEIAFISNRGGNTSLWIQDALGGAQRQVIIKQRQYLKPMGRLTVTVLDGAGHSTSARVFVTGADQRAYAPDDVWMRADDNFDRSERRFEAHYFHTTGTSQMAVPLGQVTVEAMKGIDYGFVRKTVQVAAGQNATVSLRLAPLNLPAFAPREHWVSGDVHVHMNYAGAYRDTPERLIAQADAENLPILEDLIVNKEQRIPDIAYFTPKPDPASNAGHLLLHAQEYHTSYWGHLGLLHLTRNFLIPGYAAYPGTAAASLFPTNATVADMGHEQQAVVGYVHPFDVTPDPYKDASLTDELPVDVALHKVDYIEIVGFSDHKSTASIWYRLLNLGFHLPTAAGTDAMANYASMRGPVGLDRVYVSVPTGPLNHDWWLASLKAGHTFASNGPLLGFSLDGTRVGSDLRLPAADNNVKLTAWMRSIVPVDHLQLVCDGDVVRELKLTADRKSADVEDTVPIAKTGWCVLRAFSDKAEFPVLDIYPYATTSPVYVTVAGSTLHSPEDARFFVAWIDRLVDGVDKHKDWNSDAEKNAVLNLLGYARKIYEDLER